MLKVSDFDYHLPEELIAQEPLMQRDHSRLLVLNRSNGEIEHKYFYDIGDYLQEGDLLVFNNTKVMPARLFGKKEGTGAGVEVLLLKRNSINQWETLVKPGKKLPEGTNIIFGNGELQGRVIDKTPDGGRIIEFTHEGVFEDIIDRLGQMPLPPYITKTLEDRERYQTVYAKEQGAAAAPTAGLHFTNSLIEKLNSRGIQTAFVTLHVGLGTFRPVKVENILEHQMHAEYFTLDQQTAETINNVKRNGKRVFAVGTTTVRVLETLADNDGFVSPQDGWTDIFIYPGYKFRCVDALITNFHLPKSTLLMLISALAGKEKILQAYNTAIEHKYRFFSFGDAMLIL